MLLNLHVHYLEYMESKKVLNSAMLLSCREQQLSKYHQEYKVQITPNQINSTHVKIGLGCPKCIYQVLGDEITCRWNLVGEAISIVNCTDTSW